MRIYPGIQRNIQIAIDVKMARKVCDHVPVMRLMAVCVIKYTQRAEEKTVSQIIPVAGTFPSHPLDAKTTLLQSASSSDIEGVKVELHGQIYRDQQQSAIIELTCDTSMDVPLHSIYADIRSLENLISVPSMKVFSE